jgi:periplasmic protein CpxP/Spy
MNNSKNKILIFFVAVLLLTNIAMLFYFIGVKGRSSKGNHGEKRTGPVTGFLQNDVGFNKQQMDAFDTLKQRQRSSIKPLFDDLGKSKDSFYQLIGNIAVPDSILRTAASEIGKKQAALDLQFFQNFRNIRKICTPEQLIKFDSLMPAVVSKMMQPWQKNGPFKKGDSTRIKK